MIVPCIEPFPIPLANYNCNNYSLDHYTHLSLNLIYNICLITKVKPDVTYNSILFPLHQLARSGPVTQVRYEVEKVIEYCKIPRTGVPQCKLLWSGYSLVDDQGIYVKEIPTGILQECRTKGSLESTVKRGRTNNKRPGRYLQDQGLAIIQHKQDSVICRPT